MAKTDFTASLDQALEEIPSNRRTFLKQLLGGSAALAALPLISSTAAAQPAPAGKGSYYQGKGGYNYSGKGGYQGKGGSNYSGKGGYYQGKGGYNYSGKGGYQGKGGSNYSGKGQGKGAP